MAAFTLDTSGTVFGAGPDGRVRWPDLDAFTQGYIEALFRTHVVGHSVNGFGRLAFSDLAPEALAAILKDCAAMVAEGLILPGAVESKSGGALVWRARAQGAWASRREYPATGEVVPAFPPLTPYLGDDGRVYLREAA